MKFEKVVNQEKFNKYMENHRYGYFEQNTYWGEFREKYGWKSKSYWIYENDKIIGGFVVNCKKIPLTNKFFYYIPRGPVIDYNDEQILKNILVYLKDFFKNDAGILKIDPHVIYKKFDINMKNPEIVNENIFNIFKNANYKHYGFNKNFETIKPRYTTVIETNQTFSKSTLRKIKTAQSKDIKVVHGQIKDINRFYKLLKITTNRNDFDLRPEKYFIDELETFKNTNIIELYIAELDVESLKKKLNTEINNEKAKLSLLKANRKITDTEKIIMQKTKELQTLEKVKNKKIDLASVVAFYYGDYAFYVYGASDNAFRQYMPNYLLQNYIFEEAKKRKKKYFDLYGISGDIQSHHKYNGLYNFKKAFGQEIYEFIGEFEYVYDRRSSWILNYFFPLYIKLRKRIG